MGVLKARVGGNWIPVVQGADQTIADERFVNTTGDTLTGDLILASDPTQPLQAVTKQYVDSLILAGAEAIIVDFPVPLDTWIIDVGKISDIIVIDSAGTRVEPGNILYEGTKVTLTFSAAFSGRAYCFT